MEQLNKFLDDVLNHSKKSHEIIMEIMEELKKLEEVEQQLLVDYQNNLQKFIEGLNKL